MAVGFAGGAGIAVGEGAGIGVAVEIGGVDVVSADGVAAQPAIVRATTTNSAGARDTSLSLRRAVQRPIDEGHRMHGRHTGLGEVQ